MLSSGHIPARKAIASAAPCPPPAGRCRHVSALPPRRARAVTVACRVIPRLLARRWIALVAALAVHAALWLAAQRDLAAADPLWYATWADKLAFHPAELFAA